MANLNEMAFDIVEIFEDMLEKKDILIQDKDRQGEESEAPIYGMTYVQLVNDLICYLSKEEVKQC